MATCSQPITFASAVSYALGKLGLPHVTLKEEQRLAIKAIFEGGGGMFFVCLPTGYGKSLCFQTLPFIMDYKLDLVGTEQRSIVLVVSPLVSLMIDQVRSLRKSGVKSSIITSSSTVAKELIATDSSLDCDSLLYAAPEALVVSKWRTALEKPSFSGRIVTIVVDEAHCVSKW